MQVLDQLTEKVAAFKKILKGQRLKIQKFQLIACLNFTATHINIQSSPDLQTCWYI